MAPETEIPIRLQTHRSECRCENCPPDRVCAWACLQGAGVIDILIGAALEQDLNWTQADQEAGVEAAHWALWDSFNA
jgi:hypothetical protein